MIDATFQKIAAVIGRDAALDMATGSAETTIVLTHAQISQMLTTPVIAIVAIPGLIPIVQEILLEQGVFPVAYATSQAFRARVGNAAIETVTPVTLTLTANATQFYRAQGVGFARPDSPPYDIRLSLAANPAGGDPANVIKVTLRYYWMKWPSF